MSSNREATETRQGKVLFFLRLAPSVGEAGRRTFWYAGDLGMITNTKYVVMILCNVCHRHDIRQRWGCILILISPYRTSSAAHQRPQPQRRTVPPLELILAQHMSLDCTLGASASNRKIFAGRYSPANALAFRAVDGRNDYLLAPAPVE